MSNSLDHDMGFYCPCREAAFAPTTIAERLHKPARELIRQIQLMQQKHEQRRALFTLDDEQLTDIGISRAMAKHGASKHF